jgi:hypothetical protein
LREEEFKYWLEDQEYKTSTISTQLSSVRLIEQAYGDVDQIFDRDAFSGLFQEFAYTAKDRSANKPNPSRLKLWGNTYRDLAHLRATFANQTQRLTLALSPNYLVSIATTSREIS